MIKRKRAVFRFLHGKVMHGVHVIHVEPIRHEDSLCVSIKSVIDLEQFDSTLASMIFPPDSSDILRYAFSFKVLDLSFYEIVYIDI